MQAQKAFEEQERLDQIRFEQEMLKQQMQEQKEA